MVWVRVRVERRRRRRRGSRGGVGRCIIGLWRWEGGGDGEVVVVMGGAKFAEYMGWGGIMGLVMQTWDVEL